MRSSLLLEDALSDAAKTAVTRVLDSESTNFGNLVRVAGLNPARDFRNADLRDVNFTDTDLRGYDFTGADLRGAYGIRVLWDPASTVLNGAQIDGSIFAHRLNVQVALANEETRTLHRRVRGLPWADQVVWAMKHLRPGADDLERNRLVAASIFEQTSDSFLKGELLKYLEKSTTSHDEQLYAFILDLINGYSDDLHLIGKAIRILQRSRMGTHPRLYGALEALLQSHDDHIVSIAIQGLVSSATGRDEIRRVAEFALKRTATPLRMAFIAALTRRLGHGYDLIARDQLSNDFRDVHEVLDAEEFFLLMRKIRRLYDQERHEIDEHKRSGPGPFMIEFGQAIREDKLIDKIDMMLKVLASYGMPRVKIPLT